EATDRETPARRATSSRVGRRYGCGLSGGGPAACPTEPSSGGDGVMAASLLGPSGRRGGRDRGRGLTSRRRDATLCWNELDECWKRSQYLVCGRRRPCHDDGGTRDHHHPTLAPVRGRTRDRADDDGHRLRCRCRIGTAAGLRTVRLPERPDRCAG